MHTKQQQDPLQRARRMAQRSRAAAACLPCKTSKARCSDYRPCARCKKTGGTDICTDSQSALQNTSLENIGTFSSYILTNRSLDGQMISVVELYSDSYQQFSRASNYCAGHPEPPNAWNDVTGLAPGRTSGSYATGGAPMHPEQARELENRRNINLRIRGHF